MPLPATFARGSQCIDYGFATPHVLRALRRCGYEQFSARFTTDHRAYFFDFDTTELFGTLTPTLASPANRILKSNNLRQVTSYIKEKYEYLRRCNAFERAKLLGQPGERHRYAERLDQDMLQASLVAERRIQRFGEPAWSLALDQARKRVAILKKCLTMVRTRLDLMNVVQSANDALTEPMILPYTKRECCLRLRQAKRELKEIVATSFKRREEERKQKS
jgi:hypothetical protein